MKFNDINEKGNRTIHLGNKKASDDCRKVKPKSI